MHGVQAMAQTSIAANFGKYFELKLAQCPEQLEQAFHIRYQVYCEEFEYEPQGHFPDKMERDAFDDRALHCLMTHRETQTPVGCIRFICADSDDEDRPLPFERFCPPTSAFGIHPQHLPKACYGELSRLAVLESFRRRRKDTKQPVSLTPNETHETPEQRDAFPMIPIGLFMAGIAMFLRSEADFSFALMEPRLARLLQRFGIRFIQAGELVDHHGARAPFALPRETVVNSLTPDVIDLFWLVDQQLFGPRPSYKAPIAQHA